VPPAGEHPDQAEARAHLPDSAAALPEIVDRQAHEPVARRFQLHLGEQLVRRALVLGALEGEAAEVLHPLGQLVA